MQKYGLFLKVNLFFDIFLNKSLLRISNPNMVNVHQLLFQHFAAGFNVAEG